MPTPSPESRSAASCSASIAAVTSRVVLVTMPWRCADRMPALTPGVRPKSSALTMSRRITRRSPRRGPLDRVPLDRLGDPRRHRGLEVVGPDVIEALVADARERLDLAADYRRREARRFDLRARGLRPEEREEREDQPSAGHEMPRGARDHSIEQLPAVGAALRGEHGGHTEPAADLEHALARTHGEVATEKERARLGRLDTVRDAKQAAAPGKQEGAGVATCQGRAGSRVGAIPSAAPWLRRMSSR